MYLSEYFLYLSPLLLYVRLAALDARRVEMAQARLDAPLRPSRGSPTRLAERITRSRPGQAKRALA